MNLNKVFKTNNMTPLALFLMLSFLFVLIFLIPKQALAYSTSKIIEDSTFRNVGSMTEAQIQDFLVTHDSYLANYTIPTSQTAIYYIGGNQVSSYVNSWIGPVGQEVDSTGWPVSKVIYNASRWYNVNPQVIISIIQKESSLAADSDSVNWAPPERFARMAWIMGYAYTESGITNVCKTGTNKNTSGSCAGVAMQIDWASGALDTWFRRSEAGTLTCNGGQACSAGRTVTIDGSQVYIGNHITGPFYRYTPHYSWGGSFTWCMNNWFPQNETQRILNNLTVSSPLVLAKDNLSVGEKNSAGFVLTNLNSVPIKLDNVGVAARDSSWRNVDFGWYGEITLSAAGLPGDFIHFNTPESIQYTTGEHISWVAFSYQGTFYQATSQNGLVTNLAYRAHYPNLKATTVITPSKTPILEGQEVNYQTTIINNEKGRVYYKYLGLAARDKGDWSNSDIGWESNGFIDPGEANKKTISLNKKLKSGSYFLWTSVNIGTNFLDIWDGANVNHLDISVRKPSIMATTLITTSGAPISNQPFVIETTVKNNENQKICFNYLGLAGRSLANWGNNDIGWLVNDDACVDPNTTKVLRFTKILPAGTYYIWASYASPWNFYEIKDGANVNHTYLVVR